MPMAVPAVLACVKSACVDAGCTKFCGIVAVVAFQDFGNESRTQGVCRGTGVMAVIAVGGSGGCAVLGVGAGYCASRNGVVAFSTGRRIGSLLLG